MEIVFRNTNLQILKTPRHEFRNAVVDAKIERVKDIIIISFGPFDLDSLLARSTFSKTFLFFFFILGYHFSIQPLKKVIKLAHLDDVHLKKFFSFFFLVF